MTETTASPAAITTPACTAKSVMAVSASDDRITRSVAARSASDLVCRRDRVAGTSPSARSVDMPRSASSRSPLRVS